MRENLLDAFNNILSNQELKSRFDKIKNTDDVYAVFKDAGYPGSSEELDNEIRSVVEDFVKSKNASDGDLSGVVGGKGAGFSKKLTASALALMGIASTASGSALHALQGNNMQTTKTFDKKQSKSSMIRNIATHGATAAVVSLPIGSALIWALMRNPKSPRLQKIYKYATRADKALTEFEKAYTRCFSTIFNLTDTAQKTSCEECLNNARKTFQNEIKKIIEGMEKDKLFLDSWKRNKNTVLEDINNVALNYETAYDCVGTVFWCADIDNDITIRLQKNSDNENSWKIPWKRFYCKLIMALDNTDLQWDCTVKKKEIFKSQFENYNLLKGCVDINGGGFVASHAKDLFCEADVNSANASNDNITQQSQPELISSVPTANEGSQNTNNRKPILANVYTAMKNQDYEGTFDAFVKVLSKMGIAKKYKGKTYNTISFVFHWINQIIYNNDDKNNFGDTFKNLYNFLVQENGDKNRDFIDLMKKLAKNGNINYEDLPQVEAQVQNFWESCGRACSSPSYMDNFIGQLAILSRLRNDVSDEEYGLTPQHVESYQDWKQFHEAGDNAAKLEVLRSFNSGSCPIDITGLEDAVDFNQAVEQAIKNARSQIQDSDWVAMFNINYFEKFFNIIKNDNIRLSDIGINQYGLDIFD